jgi:hypothetical protein
MRQFSEYHPDPIRQAQTYKNQNTSFLPEYAGPGGQFLAQKNSRKKK